MTLNDGTYPRPTLVRPAHVAFDRTCAFAYDDDNRGLAEQWHRREDVFDREIQLPFAPESAASGIGETGYHAVVWYRIPITAADIRDAGRGSQGERLILHFGAVDYTADVWADGSHVAHHEGGQTAFSADITDALDADVDEHVVVVRAADDPVDGTVPRGKQTWREEPHAVWYHRTTGIWRSVWLEAVPALHVQSLVWTTDLATSSVRMDLELNERPAAPAEVSIAVGIDGELAQLQVRATEQTVTAVVPIDRIRNGEEQHGLLWSPENPRLVDSTVTVTSGGSTDTVASYVGLREVGTSDGRFLLNGRPYYLRSVLEQGYWPESHFTAPSLDALKDEVELVLSLGFNALRIHQKVEDPRFLYWCDRLGVLVWAETGSAHEFSGLAVQRLTAEWVEIVRQHRAHPSVVTWVPFNESWGVQNGTRDPAQQAFISALTSLTRALDSSRPVVSNDGWEHTESDIWTIHDYRADGAELRAAYGSRERLEAMIRGIGPAGRRTSLNPVGEIAEPIMLTEFGGVSYITGETPEDSWGYSSAESADDFERRVRAIMDAIHNARELSGFCYTQLTDTHQETNGLCDANRQPKLPTETLRKLIRGE